MSNKEDIKKTVIHFQMVRRNVSFLLSSESSIYHVVSVVFCYNEDTDEKTYSNILTFQEWLKNAKYKIVRFILNTQAFGDSRVEIIERKEFEDRIDGVVDFLYELGVNANELCISFHA